MFTIRKFTIVLFLAGINFHYGSLQDNQPLIRRKRLAFGSPVDIKQHPYFVSFITKKLSTDRMFPQQLQFCGGSIISKHWVTSSATCLNLVRKYQLSFSDWFIRSGANNWNETSKQSKDHGVTFVFLSREFRANRFIAHDVLIAKVKQPFNNPAKPIILAGPRYKLYPDVDYMVIGTGETEKAMYSSTIKAIKVKMVNIKACTGMPGVHGQGHDGWECFASNKREENVCMGDHGGPLVDYHGPVHILVATPIKGPVNCGNPEFAGAYHMYTEEPFVDLCHDYETGAKFYNIT